jgi:YHS domain-containing protein
MNTKLSLTILLSPAVALMACSKDEDINAAGEGASGGDYPLTTCVVSGEPLGSMGDPVIHDHNGTTVKFCCKNCLPKFNEDPESYISKVNEAKGS